MSNDIRINIERIDGGSWVNPVELEGLFPRDAYAHLGFTDIQVCSFSEKGPQRGLLFGPCAIVSMHLGLPDDLCPELQHLRNKLRPGRFDGWCVVDRLCLDFWETEFVLIGTRIDARLALAFGNGERAAADVRQDLQQYGMPEHEADWIMRFDTCLTASPENWAEHRRYQLQQLDPTESVPVTWRETYAECAGPDLWDRGLVHLQGLSNAQLYRLVTSYS